MSSCFMICSHGWSASNWLAYALNLHEDIVCAHSAMNLLADDKEMHSNENLRRHLDTLYSGYLSRQNRPIDEAYDEIESFGQARLYGSVHTYRLRDLPVVYEKFGPTSRSFVVKNLVRHPVSLVWSGYGQFRDLFTYDLNELHWTSGKVLNHGREFVLKLAQKYDLRIGELNNLAFLGAAVVLGSLRLDLDAIKPLGDIPGMEYRGHVKMEEVTADPGVLAELIADAGQGELAVSDDYLKAVYDAGVVNQHRKDRAKVDARSRYNMFSDWQKEAFRYFFNRFELKEQYEKMGYDLTFI